MKFAERTRALLVAAAKSQFASSDEAIALKDYLANNAAAICALVKAAELVNALSIQSDAHKKLRIAIAQLNSAKD